MLSYRTRRRLALLILLVGLPVYLVVAITAVNWMDATWGRQPIWAEVLIYLVLGFLWILPFRFVFRGIGKPDPEAEKQSERPGDRSD